VIIIVGQMLLWSHIGNDFNFVGFYLNIFFYFMVLWISDYAIYLISLVDYWLKYILMVTSEDWLKADIDLRHWRAIKVVVNFFMIVVNQKYSL
jgi:hypothetical protein